MLQKNKVYQIDCLEFMKTIPDEYFDLIITDPPFGIKIGKRIFNKPNTKHGCAKAYKKDYGTINWDDKIPSEDYFNEIKRVSKNQIIFGGNYFIKYLDPSSCWIIWDKRGDEKYNNDFGDCELAWTSFNKPSRIFRFLWSGMLQQDMRNKEVRVHPTQKPVALGRWLLKKFANEGNIIFDPFAGSGSFLVASKQLGYDFVGCELSLDYVSIINNKLSQKTLFDVTKKE